VGTFERGTKEGRIETRNKWADPPVRTGFNNMFFSNLISRQMYMLALALGAAVMAVGGMILFLEIQSTDAFIFTGEIEKKAPVAILGDNIYVTWQSNNTANNNEEVLFRASTDGGATFGDKINLSNTTNADSTRAEIDSDADSVVVTWWETNQTSDTPVMRVSTDNGATFGPMLMLATNGTIGDAEEEQEEENSVD
jgi:phage terminase large subunit GpA-like protein